ncbi:hypothetical protein JCM10212_002565 [Sporobolomyces blumeae]
MPSTIARPPPCLTINVPSTHARSSSAPAFGIISTYSQRVPPLRPARRDRHAIYQDAKCRSEATIGSADDDDELEDLEKIAVAQVSLGDDSISRPPQRSTPVHHISLGLEPPTPSKGIEDPSDPIVYRKPRPLPWIQTRATALTKQERRTASIYSVSSSTNDLTLAYLRPASLSLSHANVSQESLVVLTSPQPRRYEGERGQGALSIDDTSSGPSAKVETTPALGVSRTARIDDPGSTSASEALPSDGSPSVVRPRPDETEAAQRLQRLYLCPWETTSERVDLSRVGHRRRPSHTIVEVKQPKFDSLRRTLEAKSACDVSKVVTEKGEGSPSDHRDDSIDGLVGSWVPRDWSRIVKTGLLIVLILALSVDLLILNIRVFGKDDWE